MRYCSIPNKIKRVIPIPVNNNAIVSVIFFLHAIFRTEYESNN